MYSFLMLSENSQTHAEREEAILDLVINDPDIHSICIENNDNNNNNSNNNDNNNNIIENNDDFIDNNQTIKNNENNNDHRLEDNEIRSSSLLASAEKAKFWKVCELLCTHKKDYEKVYFRKTIL